MTIDQRLAAVIDALEEVDAELAAGVREWAEEHAACGSPVMLVVGAYSTGKTTLLRRLLVESGRPVPEDRLLVGGMPTSWKSEDVDAHGWLWRDTPGLESGRELHEAEVRQRTWFADAVQVLVTHELFTAGTEIERILTGRDVHPEGWPYPTGALRVALTRMDSSVGTRPGDAQRTRIESKRDEVAQRLAVIGVDVRAADVAALAADPRGRVANRQVDRSAFDESRDWDGVEDFVASLPDPDDAIRRLRPAAWARGALRAIAEGLEAIRGERAALGDASARGTADAARWEAEVAAARDFGRKARAALSTALEGAVVDIRSPDAAAARVLLAFRDWQDTWSDALEERAERAGVDFRITRLELVTDELRGEAAAKEARGVDRGDVIQNMVKRQGEESLKQFADATTRKHGTDLDSLAKELRGYEKAKDPEGFLEKSKLLDSEEDVAEIRRLLRRERQLKAGIAVATEAIRVVRDERDARRVERAEEQRVQDLRTRARAAAARAAERWFHGTGADGEGWQANIAEFVGIARDRAEESRAQAEAVRERDETLARTESRLLKLRDDYLAERR